MLGTQKAWIHSVFTGTMWQEWRGRSGAPSTTLFRLFLTDRNKSELFCELKEKRKSPVFRLKLGFFGGAGGGTRTHTVSLPTDFESVTSAIPSHRRLNGIIIPKAAAECKGKCEILPQKGKGAGLPQLPHHAAAPQQQPSGGGQRRQILP